MSKLVQSADVSKWYISCPFSQWASKASSWFMGRDLVQDNYPHQQQLNHGLWSWAVRGCCWLGLPGLYRSVHWHFIHMEINEIYNFISIIELKLVSILYWNVVNFGCSEATSVPSPSHIAMKYHCTDTDCATWINNKHPRQLWAAF